MPLYTDLFVRDTFNDIGVTPVTDASVSASPDIIPYANSQLNTATTPYGPPLLDKPLNNNAVNNIYVRAKNNAPGAASGQIYLYYTTANLLVNVNQWSQNLIQNYNGFNYANVAAATKGAAVFGDQPFFWNPQAGPNDHFCLIGRVQTLANPNPLPPPFNSWNDFVNWVRNNANVAWHNVQIVNTLPAQGYQNSLVSQNLSQSQTFYTFTATYSNVPAGSVLRMYALPGPGFAGFDVSATTTDPNGILPGAATFPTKYKTTIICTCVFPGGPVTPPPGANIVVESWGPQNNMHLAKNKKYLSFAYKPERLGVSRAQAGLGVNGMLVQITSFSSFFSPTPASLTRVRGPRTIFYRQPKS